MKPRVILHMMTSIDGRIVVTHWPDHFDPAGVYEQIHQQLAGDA